MKSINKTNHDPDSDSQALKFERFCDDILTVIAGYLTFSEQLIFRSLNHKYCSNSAVKKSLLDSVIRKFTITEVKTSKHMHVKMQSGHWYSWGWNTYGELGFSTALDWCEKPRRNLTLEQLDPEQLELGLNHNIAVAKNRLYCWGSNDKKQLGQDHDFSKQFQPTQLTLPLNGNIIKIIANENTNFVQTSSGIYAFGSDLFSRRGNGQGICENLSLINSIPFFNQPKTVSQIACGNLHVLAHTNDGQVFSWGSNNYGGFGVGRREIYYTSSSPIEIESLRKMSIKQIDAASHSCALMQNGQVYMWGRNGNGQLGFGHCDNITVPTHLELTFVVNAIQLVNERSFFIEESLSAHRQKLVNKNIPLRVYACGRNDYNQCGVSYSRSIDRPVEVSFFKHTPLKILSKAGLATVVLSDNNNLYSTGYHCDGFDDSGRLPSGFILCWFFIKRRDETLKKLNLLNMFFSMKYGAKNVKDMHHFAASSIQRCARKHCLPRYQAARKIQNIFKAYYDSSRYQAAIIIQRAFKEYSARQASNTVLTRQNIPLSFQEDDTSSSNEKVRCAIS